MELAKKFKERGEASTQAVRGKVAYVMIKGTKGSKSYENSEDPLYVLKNNLPIDYNWYLTH